MKSDPYQPIQMRPIDASTPKAQPARNPTKAASLVSERLSESNATRRRPSRIKAIAQRACGSTMKSRK